MEWLNFRLRIFIVLIVCIVIIGTVGFAVLEGLSYGNAIYLTMITISTVGYGDFYPVTAAGKALAIFLILGGTGSFLGLLATITETFVSKKEKAERLESINILFGVFFREIGAEMLKSLSFLHEEAVKIEERFSAIASWSEKDFATAKRDVQNMKIRIDAKKADVKRLEGMIAGKKELLFRMLENPNLHEHETFTDLLQAIFHLVEEFEELKTNKRQVGYEDHIHEDIKDVYVLLINAWLDYMKHMKSNYPHFFSFAAETSPFCGRTGSAR